jgi:hypothetical protein
MGRAAQTHRKRVQAMGFAQRPGKKSMVGWTGAVRPSRRPLSRPPQDEEFLQCDQSLTLILRSAQRARLEGRKPVMQPSVSILAQPLSSTYPTRILQVKRAESSECI